jgi:hypothetical protein
MYEIDNCWTKPLMLVASQRYIAPPLKWEIVPGTISKSTNPSEKMRVRENRRSQNLLFACRRFLASEKSAPLYSRIVVA